MKNTLIAWLFCLPFASCTSPVTQMDLSGQWTVCLDSTDVGMDASFGGKLFDTSITLPGTMGHRTKRILRIERKEYQTY